MSGPAYTTMDDGELVDAARTGQLGAFEELVARHRDKIFARALSLTRNEDEALELSQTAWVKAWQRLHQFQGEAGFATWMTRIVINLSLDHLRRQFAFKRIAIFTDHPTLHGGTHRCRDLSTTANVSET